LNDRDGLVVGDYLLLLSVDLLRLVLDRHVVRDRGGLDDGARRQRRHDRPADVELGTFRRLRCLELLVVDSFFQVRRCCFQRVQIRLEEKKTKERNLSDNSQFKTNFTRRRISSL
jgi:hypothetical protein